MLPAHGRFIRPAALFAGLSLLALLILPLLLPAHPLTASGPAQGDDEAVDIYDKQCTFWLDFDDDGEGDTEIDTSPGSYSHQETPVVGSCEFKLNTPAESAATLLLQTELVRWRSEVEIVREPGLPERKVLQPGRVEIPGLSGGMKITVEHKGTTPRSSKIRSLRDNYEHEVQEPRPFRLLEIVVTTSAGSYDRLEENASSASSAYIDAHQRISEHSATATDMETDAIVALAGELLVEGYPQIADRLLDAALAANTDDGINWWKWAAIALIVAFVIVLGAVGGIWWFYAHSSDRTPETTPPPRRGNI